jgi:hypothetical protein
MKIKGKMSLEKRIFARISMMKTIKEISPRVADKIKGDLNIIKTREYHNQEKKYRYKGINNQLLKVRF